MARKRFLPPSPARYCQRTYRRSVAAGLLVPFQVTVRETDLAVLAPEDRSSETRQLVLRYRAQLEGYIAGQPGFLTSFSPLPPDRSAPPLVRAMLEAGAAAAVGPMAAVAGAIAEGVGRDLLAAGCQEVVIENGGDIFLARQAAVVAGLFAGRSPLSGRIGIRIPASAMPCGLCTSSATVGHSVSLGRADAATVLAASAALADACATALGNLVKEAADITPALERIRAIPGVTGALVVLGEHLGAAGAMELVPLA
ncbi:MAG: UPF0280 family protein [Thermodesulfobacteriota bacterium]